VHVTAELAVGEETNVLMGTVSSDAADAAGDEDGGDGGGAKALESSSSRFLFLADRFCLDITLDNVISLLNNDGIYTFSYYIK